MSLVKCFVGDLPPAGIRRVQLSPGDWQDTPYPLKSTHWDLLSRQIRHEDREMGTGRDGG